jgi:hypothetical protein
MKTKNGHLILTVEFSAEIESCLRADLRQHAIAGRLKILTDDEVRDLFKGVSYG